MSSGYFVTGTDTGVGKSIFSAALIHAVGGRGHRTAGMKPVASGCMETGSGLANEDADLLMYAANVQLDYDLVCPYRFMPAIAPHLAAAGVGVEINTGRIMQAYHRIESVTDRVIVEGVGGWMVPTSATSGMADVAVEMGLPVILVVGARLGCINHALLSRQAIAASGLPLAGWVYNRVDPDMEAADEVLKSLETLLGAPPIADIQYSTQPEPARIAPLINLQALAV